MPIDLSYNNIGTTEMKIFAELIKKNHYVFGIHILGNAPDMYIDEKGFIRQIKGDPVMEFREERKEIAREHLADVNKATKDRLEEQFRMDKQHRTMLENQFDGMHEPDRFKGEIIQSQHLTGRSDRPFDVRSKIGSKEVKSAKIKQNCWICEGWSERRITWTLMKSGL